MKNSSVPVSRVFCFCFVGFELVGISAERLRSSRPLVEQGFRSRIPLVCREGEGGGRGRGSPNILMLDFSIRAHLDAAGVEGIVTISVA